MFSNYLSLRRMSTISSISTFETEYPKVLENLDSTNLKKRISKNVKSDKTLGDSSCFEDISLYAEIHPRDIRLIAALGDSLLTGLGVSKRESVLKNRLLSKLSIILSWSISGEHRQNNCITGGGHKVVSIARLVSVYTDLKMNFKKTVLGSRGDGFNLARTGAKSSQLQDQAKRLLIKINDVRGWKMVFIWIGANDIFSSSTRKIQETFRNNLQAAIEILRNHTSNVVVVILPVPYLDHLCETDSTRKAEIQTRVSMVNSILKDIVDSYQKIVTCSFRIVFEPFPLESRVEMISSLDNIHPSIKANELICKAVWNNLFLEKNEKLERFDQVINSSWTEPGQTDYFKFG